jgi:hypothetical protein
VGRFKPFINLIDLLPKPLHGSRDLCNSLLTEEAEKAALQLRPFLRRFCELVETLGVLGLKRAALLRSVL